MRRRIPRVVVAGQVPPPIGGQNVMVERALGMLANDGALDVEHLPFRFLKEWGKSRRLSPAKVGELFAVVGRLIKLRLAGRISLLLFPVGGPHLVPTIRDLFLLPFCYLLARKTVLHIHAGGLADALPGFPGPIRWLAQLVYGRADGAIVLTEYSRADAEVLGIEHIEVVPNTLPDMFRDDWVQGRAAASTLLYVGHLGVPKGTSQLLHAVAALGSRFPDLRLWLVGEPLAPYTEEELESTVRELNLDGIVEILGVLDGDEKWRRFAAADVFVFPSVAPESFPLVLLEALMWGLPIVATDWRAHGEILGTDAPGVCFPPGEDLARTLTQAVDTVLDQRDCWPAWSRASRDRYLSFCVNEREPLVDCVKRFVSQP